VLSQSPFIHLHNFQRKRLFTLLTLNRKKPWWSQSSEIWRRVSWRKNETGMLLLPFSGYRTTIRQSVCQLTEVLGVVQISLNCSHFAFITTSSYVHVSSLEGFFLLGKEERCHQTTTFRNWSPSEVPVRHFEEQLTISLFNIGCRWLLYGAERHVTARDFSFLPPPPPPPKRPY